jgi:hypothetical protein
VSFCKFQSYSPPPPARSPGPPHLPKSAPCTHRVCWMGVSRSGRRGDRSVVHGNVRWCWSGTEVSLYVWVLVFYRETPLKNCGLADATVMVRTQCNPNVSGSRATVYELSSSRHAPPISAFFVFHLSRCSSDKKCSYGRISFGRMLWPVSDQQSRTQRRVVEHLMFSGTVNVVRSQCGNMPRLHGVVIQQNCEKRLVASSRLPACPSAWNSSPTGQIFMKFGSGVFFENPLKIKV